MAVRANCALDQSIVPASMFNNKLLNIIVIFTIYEFTDLLCSALGKLGGHVACFIALGMLLQEVGKEK